MVFDFRFVGTFEVLEMVDCEDGSGSRESMVKSMVRMDAFGCSG